MDSSVQQPRKKIDQQVHKCVEPQEPIDIGKKYRFSKNLAAYLTERMNKKPLNN